MSFMKLSYFLVGVTVLREFTTGAKLDSGVGSNWHVSGGSATPSPLGKRDSSSLYYNSLYSNQNAESSLTPTASVVGGGTLQAQSSGQNNGLDYSNYIYQYPSLTSGSGSQYGRYQVAGNSYQTPSYAGVASSGGVNERQEPFGIGDFGGIGDGFGNGGGGILSGLTSGAGGAAAGIASALGLGGLGIFGTLFVALLGIPLLVLFILFPIAILVVAILGFPVLQLTLPAMEPNIARGLKTSIMDTARVARQALESEECIERLSCLLAKKSKRLPYESWILSKMDGSSNGVAHRVSKSIKLGRSGENCEKFVCTPAVKVLKFFSTKLQHRPAS